MTTFYASYSPTNAVDITGSITATNPSVGATGTAVPADATYTGMNVGGTLTGMVGTANGLKVDGSAVTQPISAASLPLPTGASTAAKQPALGTAGTASTDVLTVQGIASMTPLLVTQSGSGTQQAVNVAQFGGSNVVTGTGAGGSGIPRVTVSSDSSLTSVTTVSTVTSVTAISNALPAGTNLLGKVGIDQTTPGTTNAVLATNFPTTADVNSGLSGSSTLRVIEAGRSSTTVLANNNYANTNVTTSAYVQLISSTSVAINRVYVWNTSGSIIKLALGAALSEVDKLYIGPGGTAVYEMNIPVSTRVSLEALDATASSGYFLFVGLQ